MVLYKEKKRKKNKCFSFLPFHFPFRLFSPPFIRLTFARLLFYSSYLALNHFELKIAHNL